MGRHRKLTEDQIQEIIMSTESSRVLAKTYGVSYTTLSTYRRKYGNQESPKADPNVL